MIPSLAALWLALALGTAFAADDASTEGAEGAAASDEAGGEVNEDGDPLSPYRAPFDVLAERAIGTTSKPIEYNWRDGDVQLAAAGDHVYELNNFNSLRAGALVRIPSDRLLLEIGANYVWVWDSPSSELLALTPYRQPSRPPRLELDFNVALPVAEGVVTTFPRRFPAVELVFNLYGGVRYLVYPTGFKDMRVREVGAALFSPTITEKELENLEDKRLDAMSIDLGRYGLLIGVGNDIYFRQGLFISPRAMFGLPVLAPVTQTEMYFQANFVLAIGVAL